MGEETSPFTAEELKILGEEPEEPQGGPEKPLPADGAKLTPEPEKPEPEKKEEPKPEEPTTEEKQAAEAQGFKIISEKGKTYFVDDEGTKIPVKRFKSVYREGQDNKRLAEEKDRKFNLLRELGQEKYYELYPDEAPAGWKPPEKKEEKEPVSTAAPNMGNMIVKGGPHDGKTLNEVWAEDPAYANALQTSFQKEQWQREETEKQTKDRQKKESEDEINAFTGQISKELFSKEPEKLSKEEEGKVTAEIKTVLNWMHKTGRGGGVIADAYFLMNREKHLTDAEGRGGKKALESLKRPSPPSITPGGAAVSSGFSAYEEMAPAELTAIVENMSEKSFSKFLKDAPASLRAKLPSLPWA